MVATVLPQLQEVIEELEAQQTTLSEQLTDVQSKLEAIRSVSSMFEGSITNPSEPAAKAKVPTEKKKKTTAKKATSTVKSKATSKPASATKTTQKTKQTGKKKKDGRAAAWQKYTLPGVGDHPMPEAVRMILATRPNEDFKIAAVMSGLFKEEMPKTQYLKARNRISNILSGGVRDGEWFKGDRGAYRLEKPA